jgi:ATP-dependent helicase/nuclease subunit A
VKVDEDGVVKMPSRRSLLGLAWPAVEASVRLPAAVAAEEAEPVMPAGELRRLPSDFQMPEVPAAVSWKVVEEGREEEPIEFSWVGETARHVGTVVHRWLQRIAEDELKGWDKARIEKLVPQFRQDLERRGVQTSEIEMAAGLVKTALVNTIEDERGRWILGPHKEAWTEYRMQTCNGGRLVVDRRLKDKSGGEWVIDYKTSRHEGADVERFLEREQQRYAPQLKRYSESLTGARMGLYFPQLMGWREIEQD